MLHSTKLRKILTQETTRPLKQGKIVESSAISSLTTLLTLLKKKNSSLVNSTNFMSNYDGPNWFAVID